MAYVTVFDASTFPPSGVGLVAIGLMISLVGAVMVFRPAALELIGDRGQTKWPNGSLFFLFGVVWTAIAGFTIIPRSLDASEALRSGGCQVVEGRVENFHPMQREGHDTEQFQVNGTPFSYSDYQLTAGFNNTASHGGPIREGLQVRICHQSGVILRLEVAR